MLDNIVNVEFNEINLKQDTMLSFLVDEIHSKVITKFELEEIPLEEVTEEEYAEKVTEVISEMEENNEPIMDVVEEVTGAVVNAYAEANDNLVEDIAPEVDEMVTAIEALSDQYLKSSTGLISVDNKYIDAPMKSFQYVDFTKFNFLNDSKVEALLQNKGMSNKLYDNSLSVRDIVVLSVESDLEPEVIHAEEIVPGTIEEIADAVADDLYGTDHEKQQEEVSIEQEIDDVPNPVGAEVEYKFKNKYGKEVFEVLSLLTSRSMFRQLKDSILNKAIMNGDIDIVSAQSCINFNNIFTVFENIKLPETINSKLLAKLKHNLQVLNNVHTLSQCILSITGNRFEDRLILSDELINLPEYTKYTQHGGSEKSLENYIRYYHNTDTNDVLYSLTSHINIPVTGVATEDAIVRMNHVDSGIENLKNKSTSEIKKLKETTLISAFETFCKDRFINKENMPAREISNLLDSVKTTLKSNENTNIEDCVYSMLLDVYYTNNLESEIYTKTALETARVLDDNTLSITEDVSKEIDLRVFLDLTTSFINNTFIEKQ